MGKSEFIGSSMREALNKAKEVLGENAYIIESEETESGYKIYASADDMPDVSAVKHYPVTKSMLRAAKIQEYEKPFDAIKYVFELSQRQGIDRAVTESWLSLLSQDMKKEKLLIDESFSKLLSFDENWIYDLDYKKPVVVVGSPGCGKTSTIGKLAIILKSLKKNVSVVTLDTHKAGSISQLSTYLSPLDIKLHQGYDAYLKQKEEAIRFDKILLVDTPGVNILDSEGQDYCFKLSEKIRDPLTLVMPNDMSAAIAYDVAKEFKGYNAQYLIGTRFDVGNTFGTFVNNAYYHQIKPVLFSNSPKIKSGLFILSARRLLGLMNET